MSIRFNNELSLLESMHLESAIDQYRDYIDECLDCMKASNLLDFISSKYAYENEMTRSECQELLSPEKGIYENPDKLASWLQDKLWDFPKEYIDRMSKELSSTIKDEYDLPDERRFDSENETLNAALKSVFFQYDWVLTDIIKTLKKVDPTFKPLSEYALRFNLSRDDVDEISDYLWQNKDEPDETKIEHLTNWFWERGKSRPAKEEMLDFIQRFDFDLLPDFSTFQKSLSELSARR